MSKSALRSNRFRCGLQCALLLVGVGATRRAEAQASATDVKVKKPNVLLLIDTSGSMAWALNGDTDPDYQNGVGEKARWTVLTETLTGTVGGLFVNGNNNTNPFALVASNTCRAVPNLSASITTALGTGGPSGAAGPYTWPRFNGSPEDKDPVAFCRFNDARCFSPATWGSATKCRHVDPSVGGANFVQDTDGLLDTYADTLRFGIASFDTMELLPTTHTIASFRNKPFGALNILVWGTFNCNSRVDGSVCTLHDSFELGLGTYNGRIPQWSYWHQAPADTWLTGTRTGFSGVQVNDFAGASYPGQHVDVGFRNSRALPWFGRLVGFGPADWDFSQGGLGPEIECNDDDSCTASHNEMVQNVILGLERRLQIGTPLAAMMRDAYEFIRFDTTTDGTHLPHRYSADIRAFSTIHGRIGPQTDPYFEDATDRCRSTSVILVTDGEPTLDYDEPMSTYATLLLANEGVKTYVVGMGLDTARWNPGTGAVNVSCAALTAADLGTNRMCERDGTGTDWKYALPPNNGGANTTSIRACCNLLETAVEGGTQRAYFPSNQAQLKSELGQVLSGITGGAVSRTVPVFGGVTASFAANGSVNAPATSYEIRSSMEVTADGTLWRGNLERLRYACDASQNPVIQTLDPSVGDDFSENLPEQAVYPRKFFTVVTQEPDHMAGSIRPDDTAPNENNSADNLFDGGNLGAFEDFDRVAITSFATTVNGLWGGSNNDLEDILDIDGSDVSANGPCDDELGTTNEDTCGDRVLRWYGGDPNPDGGAITATDPAPSRDPSSAQCVGTCSPLGAVYRSVPVLVPPPSVSENDDQNFSRTRTGATPSFVQRYGERPTMLYSQTVDGQLHAFVVAKNQYLAPTVGPALDFTTDVPMADTADNNEIWTFIPPAVMPKLWDNFNTAARLLDGQLTWANVVYHRELGKDLTDDFAAVTTWDYATVLVGCSGETQISRSFCYALDVTDPVQPEFLWQLSTAGDGSGDPDEPLFGDGVAGVAVAHVRVGNEVLAVAIIPGGAVDGTPTKSRKRKSDPGNYWAGDREPRSKVWDWSKKVDDGSDPDGDDDAKNGSDNLAARTLTFVELKTGRIVARMASDHNKDSPDELDPSVLVPKENTLFDSPFTGIPAVWPGGARIAERIYLGDADGTLWRIEIDSSDITDWEAHIAFDAYNHGSAGDATLHDAWVPAGPGANGRLGLTPNTNTAAKMGQPIQNAPLLSTDEAGDVVVTFATGDQETFNTVASNKVNLLISFIDRFDASKDPSDDIDRTGFQAFIDDDDNGVELAWKDGGQVTGPLNLFDGQLYFSYYVPAATSGCGLGTGGMCGLHYVDRDAADGGEPKAANTIGASPCTNFSDGSVVFGISISLVPSCTVTENTFSDPWLSGDYKAVTEANAGRYELVFHTGQSGGTPDGGGETKRNKVQLPAPKSRTTVRSFVRVAETDL